jgi:hypothetical protein
MARRSSAENTSGSRGASAFDGANSYVIGLDTTGSTQSLERIPYGGGCPVFLANMPVAGQGSVSVDDECVYGSNSEDLQPRQEV